MVKIANDSSRIDHRQRPLRSASRGLGSFLSARIFDHPAIAGIAWHQRIRRLIQVCAQCRTANDHKITDVIMRPERITEAFPQGSDEASYLVECARRLEELFIGLQWSVELGLALIALMNAHSIGFDDGFVLGDDSQLSKTIGYLEAELIVSSILQEPNEPAEWWRDMRLGPDGPRFGDDSFRLIWEHVKDHPSVAVVT